MTLTEKKTTPYNVNDDVYVLDTEIYKQETCIHGIVKELGDETICIKWDDLTEETEYELSNIPQLNCRPILTLKEKYENVKKVLSDSLVIFESMANYPEQYPLWDADKSKLRFENILKTISA